MPQIPQADSLDVERPWSKAFTERQLNYPQAPGNPVQFPIPKLATESPWDSNAEAEAYKT